MAGIIVTRGRIVGLALAGGLAGAAVFWIFQPDRQLRWAWDGLLDTVEARNTTRLGRVLAEDYHDRWGYTRRTILDDARLAFLQLHHLNVIPEHVRIERAGDQATIMAILRLEADGAAQIDEARASVNALFTPFVFTWRREPGFTGAWRLVCLDHPELDLARFRPRW